MAYQTPLVTTVAGLPAASSSNRGLEAIVTDSLTLTPITGLGLAPVGGGVIVLKVWSNGVTWLTG